MEIFVGHIPRARVAGVVCVSNSLVIEAYMADLCRRHHAATQVVDRTWLEVEHGWLRFGLVDP